MIKILNSSLELLARLDKLINPVVNERINGEFEVSFVVIKEELKTDYLYDDTNILEIEDNYFRVAQIRDSRDSTGSHLIAVQAEHISYDLINDEVESFVYTWATAQTMIQALLLGTPFSIGTINVAGSTAVQLKEEYTKREVLNSIASNFNGELEFNKYSISLLTERGQDRGVRFIVGKNIQGITRTIDYTSKNESDEPKVSYDISIVELNTLEEYKGLEGFNIGDRIKIYDKDIGIDISARILEYNYDLNQRINSRVVLGNYIDSLAGEIVEQRKRADLVKKKRDIWDRSSNITEDGTFLTTKLEGTISALQNEVLAGAGTVHLTEDNGILITDQPSIESSTKAIRLLGGLLAISNEKDINGDFIFRTFGDGDGFTADLITAGTIDASIINVDNLTFGDIGGTIEDTQLDEDIITDINSAVKKGELQDSSIMIGDGNGLTVLDGSSNIRAQFGQYEEGVYGMKATHADGSYTLLDQDGLRRRVAGTDKDYLYLVSTGTSNTSGECYLCLTRYIKWSWFQITDLRRTDGSSYPSVDIPSPGYEWTWVAKPAGGATGWDTLFGTGSLYNDNGMDSIDETDIVTQIPDVWVTLPSDFTGKNFKVSLSISAYDLPNMIVGGSYQMRIVGNPKFVLKIVAQESTPVPRFKVRAYFLVRNKWTRYQDLPSFGGFKESDQMLYAKGIEFTYTAVV